MRRLLVFWNFTSPVAFLGLWAFGWFWLGLALLFLGHMGLLWGVLRPGCLWLGPVQLTIPEILREQSILLTFDDGPDPIDTPYILESLAARKLRAVFFVIGKKAAAYPELVRAIAAAGHAVGNHTQTHPQTWFWALWRGKLTQEVEHCQNTIRNILGSSPTLFRAPVGHQNFFLAPLLHRLGLTHLGWTARGLDGILSNPSAVLANILPGVRPGAILLLHEGRADSTGQPLIRHTLPSVLEKMAPRFPP